MINKKGFLGFKLSKIEFKYTPLKCSSKDYLYYGNKENSYIDKKEAQKLWEYLHENRKELYIFKQNSEENQKHIYLLNIEFFKEHLKKEFVNKKITQLKQGDKTLDISIFPNGRLYDMNGEHLSDEGEVLKVLYGLAKEGKIGLIDRVFSHENTIKSKQQ